MDIKKEITSLKTMLVMLLLAEAQPLFAQGDMSSLGLGKLEGFVKNLQSIFTGGIVKAVLIMCLCGCAIAYGFNKDNEKIKRNVIAIAIAIAILIAASSIVNTIWGNVG